MPGRLRPRREFQRCGPVGRLDGCPLAFPLTLVGNRVDGTFEKVAASAGLLLNFPT